MELLPKRVIQCIDYLSRSKNAVNGDVIGRELGITARTLRSDLTSYSALFEENGFRISAIQGTGYVLDIFDTNSYHNFLAKQMKLSSDSSLLIPVFPEERVNYIIRKFLVADGDIKSDDLCDELLISRSTLSKDLKMVREQLAYFNLELVSKPSHGLCIQGSEFHLRSCISMYFFHIDPNATTSLNNSSTKDSYNTISKLLYETMEEASFKLTNLGFENLVTHLTIALIRLRGSEAEDAIVSHPIMASKEFELAQVLSKKLEDHFSVPFSNTECIYIAMHLSGKKSARYMDESSIPIMELQDLFKTIFEQIQSSFQIDLSDDIELYTALALHFQPMKSRQEYGMHIENPLLDEIKSENSESFEMSVLVASVIKDYWGYQISEEEIGYIALHFALSIERYRSGQRKKNVIIVCASGVGSSQILYHKVRQRFRNTIDELKVMELYSLNKKEIARFDFILSTVPILEDVGIPVIQVHYFLNDSDISEVESILTQSDEAIDFIDMYYRDDLFFTNLISKSRDDVIVEMCKNIRLVHSLPDNFEEEVLNRENYASTEFGNAIAIPHPMHPMCSQTFVAIGILNKPILWDKLMVKFIFLISVSKDSQESLGLFHEVLAALTLDTQAMVEFEKEPTISQLKTILKRIAAHESDNSIDVLFD